MKLVAALILALCLILPCLAQYRPPPTVPSMFLIYGGSGALPSAVTRYLGAGSAAISVTAQPKLRLPRACTLISLSINAGAAPGGVLIDTYTIQKNGSDTAAILTLTGVNTTSTAAVNVSFAAGDLLSVKLDSALLTSSSDVLVTLEFK